MKDVALAVASSGIAVTLLDEGKTVHSTFKIPLDLDRCEYPTSSIKRGTAKAAIILQAKVIVWNEVPMTHKKATEAVEMTLRDIMGRNELYGGK